MAAIPRTATAGWRSPLTRRGRRRPRSTRAGAAAPGPDPTSRAPSASSYSTTTSAPAAPAPPQQQPLRPEDISIEVVPSVEAVGRDAWDAIARHALSEDGGDNPFVFYAFLHAAEASGSAAPKAGWLPQHLVARAPDARILGLAPLYMKAHSAGEYVFDSAWASAYGRAGGRYFPKALCGVPFTPVSGPRLLVRDDPATAAATRTALARGIASLTDDLGLSSAHCNFLDAPSAAAFKSAGVGFVERLGIQFHFSNPGYPDFAAFEASLKQSRRKAVRQERKRVRAAGLAVDRLPGCALSPGLIDRFYSFYVDTALRRWGEPYFEREFFHRLFDAETGLPSDRVMLVVAAEAAARGTPGEAPGSVVAGALNLVGSRALFGRHWGAAPGSSPPSGLHFELSYYQAIEAAIERGLPRVEAGAQGQDTKLPRGYLPAITRSAHFLRDPGLRGAVADFCAREAREVDYAVSVLGVRDSPYKVV
jgi:uncharacterized protein